MAELQSGNGRMDLNESKSSSVKNVIIPADSTESSTVKCIGLSVSECDRTRVNDSELSPTDDASTAENSRLLQPQPASKLLALDLALQSAEVPVERLLVRDAGSLVCDALPICTQIPPSIHISASLCTTCSFHPHHNTTSTASKSEHGLKTAKANHQESAGDDLCASLVLACLFCRGEECVSAAADVLQQCVSFLCAKLCCCDPASLEPVLEVFPSCDPAGCLDPHCCLCGECSVCELCLHATECLELGMEVSQLLFH
ncbi:uncharacterized protein si:dkey-245f22.3 [Colossoma macropomum]|uniref:uncharacterized protein si:dkey-245f22.3 n=1 Tax=Colossoma macropomum TaxID=42526 RepID=UPI00186471D6|nr:uncharacterized protein si:dkey-245f22.3 [Colossoma macropomum]